MAESESGADKSEQPTSKRLEEARKKGQIARSKELNTLVVTLGGAGGLLVFGAGMADALLGIMRGTEFIAPAQDGAALRQGDRLLLLGKRVDLTRFGNQL